MAGRGGAGGGPVVRGGATGRPVEGGAGGGNPVTEGAEAGGEGEDQPGRGASLQTHHPHHHVVKNSEHSTTNHIQVNNFIRTHLL